MQIALILASAALVLVPATGLAQKPKPAMPKDTPVVAPKEEKKHVIATPAPFNVGVARRMAAEDVMARMEAGEKITIVDTRSKFTGPIAKGAVHLTDDKLAVWAKDIPKDTLIVAYCT
jgi:hypothetical protein